MDYGVAMNQLLTISIPTYNRYDFLRESLDELLVPCEELGIEICVSDNHSSDKTVDYLRSIEGKFKYLKIYFQETNTGIDANMLHVAAMATSDYVYLLGDDDFLPAGYLKHILSLLINGHDLIILNGWHTNSRLLRLSTHLNAWEQGSMYLKPDSAFMAVWDKMPFGSFISVKKPFLTDILQSTYIGTSHAYTGLVWDYLAEKYKNTCKVNIICDSIPTVMLRGAEKTWRAEACRIMLLDVPQWFCCIAKNAIYKDACNRMLKKYRREQTTILQLVRYRLSMQLTIETVALTRKYFNKVEFCKMLIFSQIPISACQVIQRIICFLRRVLKNKLVM